MQQGTVAQFWYHMFSEGSSADLVFKRQQNHETVGSDGAQGASTLKNHRFYKRHNGREYEFRRKLNTLSVRTERKTDCVNVKEPERSAEQCLREQVDPGTASPSTTQSKL